MNNSITIEKDKNPKRKKSWLVRWPGEFNPQTGKAKRPCKGFYRRIEAQSYADEKQRELDSGLRPENSTITLQDFTQKYLSIRKKDIGIKTYLDYEDTVNRLLDYFGNYCPLQNIQKEHCVEFIADLKPLDLNHIKNNIPLADSTRRKILRNSAKLFKTAEEWGYHVPVNLFSSITMKKPRKMPWYYISNTEFKKILENTPSLRLKTMYSLCYGCGLRLGEMQNIIAEQNFNLNNKQLKLINRPGTSDIPPFQLKDYEERTIPIPQWVMEILSQWWLKADNTVPFLFLTKPRWEIVKFKWQGMLSKGKADEWKNEYMMNNCLRDFKLYCRKAGIRTSLKLNIHGLRRGYATNLANSGQVPPHTLQKLLGHSDVKTSMDYYVGHSDANTERAVEALDRMMEEAG